MIDRRAILALLSSLPLLTPRAASAVDYPTKVIRLVVGYPPGGATDLAARLIAQRMSEKFDQPVIVENRPGAATEIANSLVARSPADGYTLLFAASGMVINLVVKKNRNDADNVIQQLKPISLIGKAPFVILTNPGVKADNLMGLIELAKKDPGKLTFASFGVGTSNHLVGELLKATAGIDIKHIPFSGSAPAVTALLGGHVDIDIETIAVSLPLIEAKKVKVLAITEAERSPLLPNVPTMAEATGMQSLVGTSWYGLLAPLQTPDEIIQKLEKATVEIVKTPQTTGWMEQSGVIPVGGTSAEFKSFIAAELKKWGDIADKANIKTD